MALPCEPDSEAREFQINILGGGCIVSENIYELSVPQHGEVRQYLWFRPGFSIHPYRGCAQTISQTRAVYDKL